jgi:hypothetical protein
MLQLDRETVLYITGKRAYFSLIKEIIVERVQKHCGHVRFLFDGYTVAMTYKGNKGKYKFLPRRTKNEELEANI